MLPRNSRECLQKEIKSFLFYQPPHGSEHMAIRILIRIQLSGREAIMPAKKIGDHITLDLYHLLIALKCCLRFDHEAGGKWIERAPHASPEKSHFIQFWVSPFRNHHWNPHQSCRKKRENCGTRHKSDNQIRLRFPDSAPKRR